MTIDPRDPLILLLAAIGSLSPVIGILFRMFVKSMLDRLADKDRHIADLRVQLTEASGLKEIVYQMKEMSNQNQRAMDEIAKLHQAVTDRGRRGMD